MKLGIIADDLTGAMDTGVQFARAGLHTVVMLDDGDPPPAEVVVISTDSRDEPAAEAYRRARDAALRLAGRTVYKKIDSTLRGNLGPELEGVMDGLGLSQALVAPAFPANGRTTVDGCHRVHGVPLAESAFAHDPLWPATGSHLPTLLARQTRRRVAQLPLAVVDGGEEAVMRTLVEETTAVVVADAATEEHLRVLASALARMEPEWLPCGSAGLAGEWPRALGMHRPEATAHRWPPDPRPALLLAGSRNSATARQLERAAAESVLDLFHLPVGGDEWAQAAEDATAALSAGRSVALATTLSPFREGYGPIAARRLAQAAAWILARSPVAGLFMTGGDVARAVCRELGAAALQALGEVQAGVPAGLLVGGPHEGLRVVTKAGGFGDHRAIIQSIEYLRGELA
jgi:D-threonate/D-erythronate kinase